MKIRAIGPSLVPPYVPNYVVLEDGRALLEDGRGATGGLADRNDFVLPSTYEVPDGSWIGVCGDGTVEVFKKSDEGRWRARQAEACVSRAHEIAHVDPLSAVKMLRGAASLVGLSIPSFVQSLEARRVAGESLADAFDRVRKASS